MTSKKVNQEAEGKTFAFLSEDYINSNELKAFDFKSKKQVINISAPEFSAVCPFSGLPDIALIRINYRPASGLAIELKSLKYYFTSFRNVGIYQEAVTAKIYKDMKKVLMLNEGEIEVQTVYNTRGGIDVICTEGKLNDLLLFRS